MSQDRSSPPQGDVGVRAQKTSEEAGWWLTAIAESADDAIIGTDLRGGVTFWNNAAEAMFGYAAPEVIGQPISVTIPPERLDEEASVIDRVWHGEKLAHFETERRHKNGRTVPVSLTVSPICDAEGRIIGALKIASDLSQAQQARQELQRRDAIRRSVLETVPDALVVIDDHGLIQSFSATAERMFGFHEAEIVGKSVTLLMPATCRDEHDGYIARYLATGDRRIIGTGRVVVGQRRDGSTFPVEIAVGEVNLPGTHLFTGFIRDLTERQDREQRFNELQSELAHVARLCELGQMVSTLAHEVTQPLTAIANYANAARRLSTAGNQQGTEQALERIAEQAAQAGQIIQRLRDLARKGETEKRVESLLNAIVEASALALVGIGKGVKLDIRVADDAAEAVIDKIQIQQVLLNLMRNAVEAMAGSARRELTVMTARAEDMVEIRVADTGPGLPEQVRARLFHPFVTTKPNGMGVGLSVCRTIIEAHGGELRAEDGESGGTVFRFTVPQAQASDQKEPR